MASLALNSILERISKTTDVDLLFMLLKDLSVELGTTDRVLSMQMQKIFIQVITRFWITVEDGRLYDIAVTELMPALMPRITVNLFTEMMQILTEKTCTFDRYEHTQHQRMQSCNALVSIMKVIQNQKMLLTCVEWLAVSLTRVFNPHITGESKLPNPVSFVLSASSAPAPPPENVATAALMALEALLKRPAVAKFPNTLFKVIQTLLQFLAGTHHKEGADSTKISIHCIALAAQLAPSDMFIAVINTLPSLMVSHTHAAFSLMHILLQDDDHVTAKKAQDGLAGSLVTMTQEWLFKQQEDLGSSNMSTLELALGALSLGLTRMHGEVLKLPQTVDALTLLMSFDPNYVAMSKDMQDESGVADEEEEDDNMGWGDDDDDEPGWGDEVDDGFVSDIDDGGDAVDDDDDSSWRVRRAAVEATCTLLQKLQEGSASELLLSLTHKLTDRHDGVTDAVMQSFSELLTPYNEEKVLPALFRALEDVTQSWNIYSKLATFLCTVLTSRTSVVVLVGSLKSALEWSLRAIQVLVAAEDKHRESLLVLLRTIFLLTSSEHVPDDLASTAQLVAVVEFACSSVLAMRTQDMLAALALLVSTTENIAWRQVKGSETMEITAKLAALHTDIIAVCRQQLDRKTLQSTPIQNASLASIARVLGVVEVKQSSLFDQVLADFTLYATMPANRATALAGLANVCLRSPYHGFIAEIVSRGESSLLASVIGSAFQGVQAGRSSSVQDGLSCLTNLCAISAVVESKVCLDALVHGLQQQITFSSLRKVCSLDALLFPTAVKFLIEVGRTVRNTNAGIEVVRVLFIILLDQWASYANKLTADMTVHAAAAKEIVASAPSSEELSQEILATLENHRLKSEQLPAWIAAPFLGIFRLLYSQTLEMNAPNELQNLFGLERERIQRAIAWALQSDDVDALCGWEIVCAATVAHLQQQKTDSANTITTLQSLIEAKSSAGQVFQVQVLAALCSQALDPSGLIIPACIDAAQYVDLLNRRHCKQVCLSLCSLMTVPGFIDTAMSKSGAHAVFLAACHFYLAQPSTVAALRALSMGDRVVTKLVPVPGSSAFFLVSIDDIEAKHRRADETASEYKDLNTSIANLFASDCKFFRSCIAHGDVDVQYSAVSLLVLLLKKVPQIARSLVGSNMELWQLLTPLLTKGPKTSEELRASTYRVIDALGHPHPGVTSALPPAPLEQVWAAITMDMGLQAPQPNAHVISYAGTVAAYEVASMLLRFHNVEPSIKETVVRCAKVHVAAQLNDQVNIVALEEFQAVQAAAASLLNSM